MNKYIFWTLIISIIICIIIGIPMWVVGCNPNVKNGCLTREIVEGTVANSTVSTETCSSCSVYCYVNKMTICCMYDYYDCYDVTVDFAYGNNDTNICLYLSGTYDDIDDATNTMNSYSLGSLHQLLLINIKL